jgi:thiamine biosynthesis protein ThiI
MMVTILIRFAELGLKSEKVRSRFLRQLADDIEESLMDAGIEYFMEVKRSRIFLETEHGEGAGKVLKRVPGIYSFSEVVPSPSGKEELMVSLSEFGRSRIRKGMTYGLKVRRTGKHPYTSQEIAVDGGGAVVSHLAEDDARVNLKDPDIWIEVEIRDGTAYIFDSRTKGMGGMPASSQGKVILFLPPPEGNAISRSVLSFILMRRRGCKVIPVTARDHVEKWAGILRASSIGGGTAPFILDKDSTVRGLVDAVNKLKAWGVVYPAGPGEEGGYPVLHSEGMAVSQFYPTISMDMDEVGDWTKRLNG